MTSFGSRVGEITLDGSIAFVIFIGLVVGIFAGILWVVAAPWLPGGLILRAAQFGAIVAAATTFFVVRAGERDFRILGPAPVVVGMVVALAIVLGAVVAVTDPWLRRRVPAADVASDRWITAYRGVFGFGLMFMILVVGAYLGGNSDTGFRAPADVGLALLVAGGATLAWWALRIREDRREPPLVLTVLGRGALLAAVALGIVRLTTEVQGILAVAAA